METRSRRGSALVSSLVVVMVAAAFGAAMLQMEAGFGRSMRASVDTKRALYVAEAGLSEAFLAVVQGKGGTIGTAEHPASFADGVFWVESTQHPDGRVSLTSNGLCDSGRFSVKMTIEPRGDTVGSLGLFGSQKVDVGAGSVIDGYDSSLGSYASQATNTAYGTTTQQGAKLGSNGNVYVHNTVTLLGLLGTKTAVFGNIQPGPGSAAIIDPGAYVTGSTTPRSGPATLPDVNVPPLALGGDLNQLAGTRVVGPGDFRMNLLRVQRSGKVVLTGPANVVVANLTLDARSELCIDTTNGPVGLYCTDTVTCAASSTFSSVTKKPADAAMMISATQWVDRNGDGTLEPPVDIQSSGEFYGLMYAPRTQLSLPSTMHVYGGAAAQDLSLVASTRSTIDKQPAGAGVGVRGVPKFIAWKVVELPDVPLVRQRVNPLVALKLAGVTPVKSSLAAPEQNMQLKYVDASTGLLKSYNGPASLFDWTQVAVVRTVNFVDRLVRLGL